MVDPGGCGTSINTQTLCDVSDPLRFSSTDGSKMLEDYPSPELPPLAGHESKRIILSDAKGLRRRAEHLLALAKKARDNSYTQSADLHPRQGESTFRRGEDSRT